MMKYLWCVVEEFGCMIVIVLYDINFVGYYVDYICVMKDGVVVEFGVLEVIMIDDVFMWVFDIFVCVVDGLLGLFVVYY